MNFHMQCPAVSASKALPASAMLDQLEHVLFNHVSVGRRHPEAVYRLTVRAIVEAFDEALDAYDNVVADGAGEGLPKALEKVLVRALERLLHAVFQHFEDAKCALQLVLGDLPASQVTRHLRDYEDAIRPARAFCAAQANEMKHRQGRVNLIHVEVPQSILWGYFIVGVGKHGDIGPNPNVHKTNTAYSFGRCFRMLIASVLLTSKALAAALGRHPLHRFEQRSTGLGGMLPIVERVAAFPRVVFWDETEVCPDIRVTPEGVEVVSPTRRRWKRPPKGSRIKFHFTLDKHSDTHRLPYMGNYMEPT